jgi:hypothetical protein
MNLKGHIGYFPPNKLEELVKYTTEDILYTKIQTKHKSTMMAPGKRIAIWQFRQGRQPRRRKFWTGSYPI